MFFCFLVVSFLLGGGGCSLEGKKLFPRREKGICFFFSVSLSFSLAFFTPPFQSLSLYIYMFPCSSHIYIYIYYFFVSSFLVFIHCFAILVFNLFLFLPCLVSLLFFLAKNKFSFLVVCLALSFKSLFLSVLSFILSCVSFNGTFWSPKMAKLLVILGRFRF